MVSLLVMGGVLLGCVLQVVVELLEHEFDVVDLVFGGDGPFDESLDACGVGGDEPHEPDADGDGVSEFIDEFDHFHWCQPPGGREFG